MAPPFAAKGTILAGGHHPCWRAPSCTKGTIQQRGIGVLDNLEIEVKALQLAADDILVFRTPALLPREQAEELRAVLSERFKGHEILVITGGTDITAACRAEIERLRERILCEFSDVLRRVE
jgi:hypothetical protein